MQKNKYSKELRLLTPSEIKQLGDILDFHELWKQLLNAIPKNLEKNKHDCDITLNNPAKYNDFHCRLIENESEKNGKSCTAILLDNWGTSGRIRPTLGHLLHLLVSLRLFRAADYVAVHLLKQPPPQRPLSGPEARITIGAVEVKAETKLIRDFEPPMIEVTPAEPDQNEKNVENKQSSEEFKIPSNDSYLPNFDKIDADSSEMGGSISSESINLTSNEIQVVKEVGSNGTQSDANIPCWRLLKSSEKDSEEKNLETLNFSMPNFNDIPAIISETITKNDSTSSLLSNLNLTNLHYFSYNELELSTNYFNKDPFREEDENGGRFLGSGNFGTVFLALNLHSNKFAAVKKLKLDSDSDDEEANVTMQFSKEVQTLCKYKHKNLVSLIGYSNDNWTYCLVYEYVSGGTLKDKLKDSENKLTCSERLNIAIGTANALLYLHTAYENPLIHRDVKPSNILLDENKNPKLCDFGIISLLNNDMTSNVTSNVIGTVEYMAPEAFAGEKSTKLDSFSLGMVYLQLLTALPPIVLDEDGEKVDLKMYTCDKYVNGDVMDLLGTEKEIWKENSNIANEFLNISLKCLELDQEIRPDMAEITKLLTDVVG